jgi:hypothetical protein
MGLTLRSSVALKAVERCFVTSFLEPVHLVRVDVDVWGAETGGEPIAEQSVKP